MAAAATRISCSECKESFADVEELEAHVAATHMGWLPFECALGGCRFFAPTRGRLFEHCADKHAGVDAKYHFTGDVAKERRLADIVARSQLQVCGGASSAAVGAHRQSASVGGDEDSDSGEETWRDCRGDDDDEGTAPTTPADAPIARRPSARFVAAQRQRRKAVAVSKRRRANPKASSGGDRARQVKANPAATKNPRRSLEWWTVGCRLCAMYYSESKLRHVTDYHVFGFVYRCSDCNYTTEHRGSLGYHLTCQRKQGSHEAARELSNCDQLKATVRAVYVKCFGQAAAKRANTLRRKDAKTPCSSERRSAAAGEPLAAESVNGNDAAAWSTGSDEPQPSTSAEVDLSGQSMRRKYVQEGESDQSTVSSAGARRREIRGQVDWHSDGGDSTADAPAATEQQAAAASAASARVLPDVERVPPPLNHKPSSLLVKKEKLDADIKLEGVADD